MTDMVRERYEIARDAMFLEDDELPKFMDDNFIPNEETLTWDDSKKTEAMKSWISHMLLEYCIVEGK